MGDILIGISIYIVIFIFVDFIIKDNTDLKPRTRTILSLLGPITLVLGIVCILLGIVIMFFAILYNGLIKNKDIDDV